MDIFVTKNVEVAGKTKRGNEIKVKGSNGMFHLSIGKTGKACPQEQYVYTEELEDVITALVAFRDTMAAKQNV